MRFLFVTLDAREGRFYVRVADELRRRGHEVAHLTWSPLGAHADAPGRSARGRPALAARPAAGSGRRDRGAAHRGDVRHPVAARRLPHRRRLRPPLRGGVPGADGAPLPRARAHPRRAPPGRRRPRGRQRDDPHRRPPGRARTAGSPSSSSSTRSSRTRCGSTSTRCTRRSSRRRRAARARRRRGAPRSSASSRELHRARPSRSATTGARASTPRDAARLRRGTSPSRPPRTATTSTCGPQRLRDATVRDARPGAGRAAALRAARGRRGRSSTSRCTSPTTTRSSASSRTASTRRRSSSRSPTRCRTGYDLVLKEHPMSIGRNPLALLRRLRGATNVRLVDPHTSSHELIRARAGGRRDLARPSGSRRCCTRSPVLTARPAVLLRLRRDARRRLVPRDPRQRSRRCCASGPTASARCTSCTRRCARATRASRSSSTTPRTTRARSRASFDTAVRRRASGGTLAPV